MRKSMNRGIFIILALVCLAPAPSPPPASGKKGGPMVAVPAGEFWMGCNDRVDTHCGEDEKPYHKVYLDAYSIDKFEVTNAEYQECVQSGKCREPEYNDSSSDYRLGVGGDKDFYQGFVGDRQPVVGVSWEDAKSYCEWAGKRLPTEAEWEKAARGTDGRKYPWGNQTVSCGLANYGDCKKGKTVAVGSYSSGSSPYGALDMAGNVWEWVLDWYDEGYYQSSGNRNPKGPVSGSLRVLRGGSWNRNAEDIRSSARYWHAPSDRYRVFGFRCASD